MYIVTVKPNHPSHNNLIYERVNGSEANILFMEKGYRGGFEFKEGDDWTSVSTSQVIDVINEGDDVRIKTLNTEYFFERIKEEV